MLEGFLVSHCAGYRREKICNLSSVEFVPSQPSAVSGSGQGRHVYLASLASHLGNHKDSHFVRKRAKVTGGTVYVRYPYSDQVKCRVSLPLIIMRSYSIGSGGEYEIHERT